MDLSLAASIRFRLQNHHCQAKCHRYSHNAFNDVLRTNGFGSQVFRDRDGTMGIVDLATKDDMKYAIRKLDDSEFKNPFEKAYIRVKEDTAGRSRSRSRSKSYDSRSRSRSYDSRSRSRSPSRDR